MDRQEHTDSLHRVCGLTQRSVAMEQQPATETAGLSSMLDVILVEAVALQGADFGVLQLFDTASRTLSVVAHRGLTQRMLDRFRAMVADGTSTAARALQLREPIIIEDVRQDALYLPNREEAEQEGYRAIHASPIIGRDHQAKGVLCTLFREPHRPSAQNLQLTDLYMRLAAESLERAQNEQALRMALDAANRASQAKSRFLATASHDLRQPLQTLSLLNGTLLRIADPASMPAVEQQGQAIGAMSRLLNALLDISKLEAGMIKPDPQDFEVASLFAEMRAEFASIAASKGLALRIDPGSASIHTDRSLLGQIVRNLLSNAIKYTAKGSVQLRCMCDSSLVHIEVEDTGVGIGAEQLPKIFDEFYQIGVPTNTSRDGYGLGLSIVRRLVELLELRMDVRSHAGCGSVFSLSMPAADHALQPESTARAARQRRAVTERHVLLVEDDGPVRMATSMLLRVEGYKVTSAASVAEAMQHADDGFDLLVTDYHLQNGETGLQLISSLRQRRGAASLKSILITGDTSCAVKEAPRDPFMKIANKPINADELLTLLGELSAA